MVDQPDNLVLVQLRELRQEFAGAMQSVVTSMKATHRVYEKLEQFSDELIRLRGELAAYRAESRSFTIKLEGDLLHLESQNISGHGETLHALRELGELQRRTSDIEHHLTF